ncbi:YfbR-like 5'-deoxynucleotidase [Paenibacillus sp. LHD-38]|uniref:YfbR-like 5'-deoxynucleotidase n=1 Tax=Paenibacillus sp. LHD-38 TaxID=3072143 RepID=UPI00280F86F3|nr:YfbR-like 5'-deoxynucleotidase [Paenibacillus sp. LHD-38]MDQ8735812.1 HD domain-containing protein [Paenibacillus sp. LHD-38]
MFVLHTPLILQKGEGWIMKNGKFTSIIIKMHYVPRWNDYAPRYKDNAASHSFRCAALAILLGIIEERVFANKIDKLSLLARALLHDLNETVTGSIKHITKKDSVVNKYIQNLEDEVNHTIVSYLSKSLRPYFQEFIVNAEDDTYLGKLVKEIDTFDAMLFCHREDISDSSSYFNSQFQLLHDKIQNSELQSIRWLAQEFDKQEGTYNFLSYILNLDKVERWSGNFNLVPDNDATHSFRVAAISLFNGFLERERFGKNDLDVYRLVCKAILHDIVEGISGDVGSTIKKSTEDIKRAFEEYEKEIARTMVNQLPPFFHKDMGDFMINCKDETYEGEMVDIADKIDALIKTNLEMRNNPHYAETYYEQLTKIQHQFENPCVIFFLAYILHDLTYVNFVK